MEILPEIGAGSVDLVFADPPFNLGKDYRNGRSDSLTPEEYLTWCERWLSECVRALKPGGLSTCGTFPNGTLKGLPLFFATVLRNYFPEALASRHGVGFLQLFNFRYADGAQMLSMGGVIDEHRKLSRLRRSSLPDLSSVHDKPEPLEICVPPLTVREKQWLDQRLSDELRTDGLDFELRDEMLDDFRRYYRHYPTYYETLV